MPRSFGKGISIVETGAATGVTVSAVTGNGVTATSSSGGNAVQGNSGTNAGVGVLGNNTSSGKGIYGYSALGNGVYAETGGSADALYALGNARASGTVKGDGGIITKVAAGTPTGGASGQLQVDSSGHLFYIKDATIWRGAQIIEQAAAFPAGYTGQRFYHTAFKADFVFSGAVWEQISTGTFASDFPTSPAPVQGLKVFRADRSIEYFYDTTSANWLSTTIFTVGFQRTNSFSTALSASEAYAFSVENPALFYPSATSPCSIYLVGAVDWIGQSSNLDATNNWTIDLICQSATGAINTTLATTSTYASGRSAGPYYPNKLYPAAASQIVTNSIWLFALNFTKNNTAGYIGIYPPTLSYRLVG